MQEWLEFYQIINEKIETYFIYLSAKFYSAALKMEIEKKDQK